VYALIVIGTIQVFTGHVNEAIRTFELAIMLDPDNAVAVFDLGCAYLIQNQLTRAAQSFRAALEKDPKLAEAHNNLGTTYMRVGNRSAGVEEFRQAVQLSPGNALFSQNLAKTSRERLSATTGQKQSTTGEVNGGVVAGQPQVEQWGPDYRPGAPPTNKTEEAETARRAIDRIRSGPHEAMPQPEAGPATSGTGTSMTIENDTGHRIEVYLTGPASHTLQIPTGASRTVDLVPGHYSVAAAAPGTAIRPFYGVQDYAVGMHYSETFYVGPVR
jgi:hypothetical protein